MNKFFIGNFQSLSMVPSSFISVGPFNSILHVELVQRASTLVIAGERRADLDSSTQDTEISIYSENSTDCKSLCL